MPAPQLTPELEAESQRIGTSIRQKLQDESLAMARLLVSNVDPDFFGKTEFEVRDRSRTIEACAIEAALTERKKRATSVRA